MNFLLIGYVFFSLLLLIGMNLWLRRTGKSRVRTEKEKTPHHPMISNEEEMLNDVRRRDLASSVLEFNGDETGWPKEKEVPSSFDEHEGVGKRGERKKERGSGEAQIKPFQIMTVFIIGAFATFLNQSLLNVALPHMMNDLNVTANTIQWLVTGYMLVNGVLVPVSAYLVQTFSTRKLFLGAMLFFTIGSVISGFSPNFSFLLIGRLIQGVGAGIVMPLMMNVFLTIFPPEQRGKAMGVMGLAMIFAPAVGPTLSGWVVEHLHWRWLFFIAIPFALFDLILAAFWLKDVIKLTKPKLDLFGVVTSTIGLGGLLYAFSRAGSIGWGSGEVKWTIAVSVIVLIFFVWQQLTTKHPLLELKVFKYDVFLLTNVIGALINMAMMGAMVLLPIYLQSIRGFTPIEAGLLLLPGALLMGIMSPISGALFDRFGARWLAVAGLTVTIFTTWEFTKLTSETGYPHILLLYTLRMFGMSLLMMPVMTEGMNQLPRHLTSHGTAMTNTIRMVAGSLGTALLVTIMTNRTTFHQASYADVLTSTNPVLTGEWQQLGNSFAMGMHLSSQSGNVIAAQWMSGLVAKESVIQGINDSFVWATWIAVIALILSFFIKRVKVEEKPHVGRKIEGEFEPVPLHKNDKELLPSRS
ncbi:DHA2 family efflux MFS transporter permease subunit [Thermicanus aegyptius]|uniref:DHA2 family efflux MFS transporter permease subunit n=1 Tax=Thermicanus aegyptius TaxID=94009 RepID=UPI00040C6598|nr:DHA2 family efflux MFS transporter permease subunit [Thermicanus aegyptius]